MRKSTSNEKHKANLKSGLYARDTDRLFAAIVELSKSTDYNGVTAYEAEYAIGGHFYKNPSSHKGRFTELERCRKIYPLTRRICKVRKSMCWAYVPRPKSDWIADPGPQCALVQRALIKQIHAALVESGKILLASKLEKYL